ncbi:MAG: copper resistance protein CopC/CopD [Armatimonadetes bacterium]|nr:copper resistance protein CopC/CopD [Armatimonadota bacterium]
MIIRAAIWRGTTLDARRHRTVAQCRCGVLLAAVGLVAALAAPAWAHGVLEGSEPAADVTLTEMPRQVVLHFSEPVDPGFSTASVRDRSGTRISGPPSFASDARVMTVPITAASHGVFSVTWRIVSSLDGHLTAGTFAFGVGQAPPAAARSARPAASQVLIRWIGYLAAMLVAGSVLFQAAVLDPGLRDMNPPDAVRIAAIAARRLRRVSLIAGVALLLSLALEFVLQAAILREAAPAGVSAAGFLWQMVAGTRSGWTVLLRMGMILLLLLPPAPRVRLLQAAAVIWLAVVAVLIAVVGGPPAVGSTHFLYVVLPSIVYGMIAVLAAIILPQVPDVRLPDFPWVPPALSALLLAGYSLTSHAVGRGGLAVVADAAHLLAAACWIGGLGALLVVLHGEAPADRAKTTRSLVPRLSRLAAVGLGVLVVTGVYSAWLHFPGARALVEGLYGRTLLVKLAFVLPLAALGARNHLIILRRQATGIAGDPLPPPRLVRAMAGELVLAVLILLIVAALTITPPR